ncbi:MAG: hypothetical protein NVS1B14_05920 [Vulcanimicrobiaceae bacterium]
MTVRETLEELVAAWQTGDAHRAAAFFAADAVFHEARHAPITGRQAISAHFTRFFRDGPLWRFDVDEIVVEAPRAALTYRFSIKGKAGAWRERAGCAVVRLTDGLIVLWREYEG